MKLAIPLALVLAFAPAAAQAPGPQGYYRFPAIHGDTIVFTAEGDLWVVRAEGGQAQRLTSNPGTETNAAISPDGRTVAFTATYEGPTDVYTMPITGGLPTRRTFQGGATVVGWTPDGRVLYATRHYSTLPNTELVRLDTATDTPTLVPLAQAADGSYDSTGQTLFFTRQAFQGSHTRGYQGGTAQNLWRYTTGEAEARPLTGDWAGTSKEPMVWQGRIYFVSDRDGTMNLWSMTPDGGDPRQLTHHDGWDVQGASLSEGRIVYRVGADLWLYTIATGDDHLIPITLTSDLDQTREHWITKPMDWLTAAHLSPNGDRVVLTARGQVFVAPVGPGRLVEASRNPGVRYRSARFAPGGRSLYVLSDQTGETEWWRLDADGIGAPDQLTSGASVIRFDGLMSPDGQWIAFGDKNQMLWLFNVAQHTLTKIATSEDGEYSDLSWSPDSRWLAYVEPTPTFGRIVLHSLASGRDARLTDDRVDSWNPAWSPDGKWLYFLSDRTFRTLVSAPWGPRQPEPFFDDETKIYAVALGTGLRFPFRPPDELAREDSLRKAPADTGRRSSASEPRAHAPRRPAADTARSSTDSVPAVAIALDGLSSRLYEVPVPAGNYGDLAVNKGRLFWTSREAGFDSHRHLMALDIKTEPGEPAQLVDDVAGYELSADGRKLLVRQHDAMYVIDAGSGADAKLDDKTRVDLSGWAFSFPPREEWHQMFVEAWRLERDFFWDRGMHGLDWPAVLNKYLPLVDRVTDRDELSDLLAQMVSNLSALHTFVYGGDARRAPDHVPLASLGARLLRDSAGGGWRVEHIYRSDPDVPSDLGPLARPDVGVQEGDVIEAINGVATLSVASPAELLRNQAGRQVRLRVRPAGGAAARDVIVTPVTEDAAADLRYDDWEYTRRLIVDSASHDSIGYVHLRAMGSGDMAQWERDFYPDFDRQGLIIDVRHNRGGNIDSWILGRLIRKAWMYWQDRIGNPYWNMQWAFRGHLVLLVDHWTASDGEAFSAGFRRLGLGPIIGTRTWGGEIWLSSDNVLVDRGIATAAESGVYGPEGTWLIEGHGVDPDTVVDNLPHGTFEGGDAQLDAALAYLEREIHEHPAPVPPHPAYPRPRRP